MEFGIESVDFEEFVPGFEMEAGFMEPLGALSGGEMIIINEDTDSEFGHSNFFFAGFAGGPAGLGVFNADVLYGVSDVELFEHFICK